MLSITKTLRGLFARPATRSRPRPARRPLRLEWLEERTLLCNPGELDLTFDGDGKVTTDFGPTADNVLAVLVQPADGKVVAVGGTWGGSSADSWKFALARYNADGSLDGTFDGDGKLTTSVKASRASFAFAGALQSDGKILAAGYSDSGGPARNDFALVRYNSNGSLDKSFNKTGKVTTDFGSSDDQARAVATQSGGKIVVAGATDAGLALARYNSNGTLDTTFSGDGKQVTTIADFGVDLGLAIQPDGKIVVATSAGTESTGFQWIVLRYNPDGSLDSTFDADGKVTTEFGTGHQFARAVDLQSDGKIVVAGNVNDGTRNFFALARYNPDGSLDNSFDTDGKLTTAIGTSDAARGVRVQSDGKIVAAGWSSNGANWDFGVARYNTDGSLDTSFDMDGKVQMGIGLGDDTAEAVAIGLDGKIVVAGSVHNGTNVDFALARYCA